MNPAFSCTFEHPRADVLGQIVELRDRVAADRRRAHADSLLGRGKSIQAMPLDERVRRVEANRAGGALATNLMLRASSRLPCRCVNKRNMPAGNSWHCGRRRLDPEGRVMVRMHMTGRSRFAPLPALIASGLLVLSIVFRRCVRRRCHGSGAALVGPADMGR